MLSDYPLEMKRTLHNPANPAPETPERKGILFFEITQKRHFEGYFCRKCRIGRMFHIKC